MARRQHHRHGSAVRVRGNVGLVEANRIHVRGQSIGGSLEACVQSRDSFRLPHIEEIDGVDG
jgi:hypothetical protein